MQQMYASTNIKAITFGFFSVVEHTVITHKSAHFFCQHYNHFFSIVPSLPWRRKNLTQARAGKE